MKDVKQIFDWSKRVRFMAGVTASLFFYIPADLLSSGEKTGAEKTILWKVLWKVLPEYCGADFTGRRCGRICGQPEL